jgi:hypothetical protein
MTTLYTLYPSTLKTKKFDIYVKNPKTGRIKKVSFGAKGYEDYTIHKDKERRKRYLQRHKHDKLNDYCSSGFWSARILWGESTNMATNLKNTLKQFGLKR